jgi:hypothetical protein
MRPKAQGARGLFLGTHESLLKYFTTEGMLRPTPAEAARQEARRAKKLAAKRRELGLNSDQIQ